MRVGMTLPTMAPGLDREGLLGWSRRIDGGPFSSLAVGERISFPNPDILVALSAAAAVTERVRLVATVFVLPLHSTPWLAKRIASLDGLSGGRLVVGVGVGGREEDYRVVGASFARRHARMDAQVAELRRLWAGEPPVPGAAPVGPAPARPGGPPLWVAAAGERPLARAARWADGVAGFSLGPDLAEVDAVFRRAERAFAAAGRRGRPWLATSFWYALGPGARERLDAYATRYLRVFGEGAASALRRRCLAAGADALRDALHGIAALGADEVLLVPTTADPAELDRTLDVLAGLSLAGSAEPI